MRGVRAESEGVGERAGARAWVRAWVRVKARARAGSGGERAAGSRGEGGGGNRAHVSFCLLSHFAHASSSVTRDEDRDIVLDSFGGKIPSTLQDLFPAYDAFKNKAGPEGPIMQQLLMESFQTSVDTVDSERYARTPERRENAGWGEQEGARVCGTLHHCLRPSIPFSRPHPSGSSTRLGARVSAHPSGPSPRLSLARAIAQTQAVHGAGAAAHDGDLLPADAAADPGQPVGDRKV